MRKNGRFDKMNKVICYGVYRHRPPRNVMCYFMKTRFNILTALLSTLILTGCDSFGDRQNPLYGIIYRHEKEVPQFKNYKDIGGSVIDNIKDKSGNYEFGISHLTDSIRHILTFEQFIREPNNPQPKYQILDTINIDNIKENEFITYCNCRQETIFDPEIIALVIADEDKEYYDKIVRAWRADTKAGKIILIENTTGINCINEGYGLDGCGEDKNIAQPADTTNIDTLKHND